MNTRLFFAIIAITSAGCAVGADGDSSADSSTSGAGSETDGEDLFDPGTTSGGATTSGPTSGAGTTGATSGGQGGSGDVGSGACCDAAMTPGCAGDSTVEQCVCQVDAYCCDTMWDEACVGLVDSEGCGDCGGSATGGSGAGGAGAGAGGGGDPPVAGECCTPSSTPGCSEVGVQDCVCAEDQYCCAIEWDDLCVELVESASCGACM
jgi:hypothetical protein